MSGRFLRFPSKRIRTKILHIVIMDHICETVLVAAMVAHLEKPENAYEFDISGTET